MQKDIVLTQANLKKSPNVLDYIFAAVFGYLELAMGSMSYLQISCNADLVLQYHLGNLNLRQK
jgi:hypothetical protein